MHTRAATFAIFLATAGLALPCAAQTNQQPARGAGGATGVDLATQPTLYVVGYAHLDTEWRWEFPQVIDEYLSKTLRSNFMLFQKYPHYIFNFTGAMIWAATIVSVGFLFGGSWDSLVRFVAKLHWLTLAAIGVVVLVAAIVYFVRRRNRAKTQRLPQDSTER